MWSGGQNKKPRNHRLSMLVNSVEVKILKTTVKRFERLAETQGGRRGSWEGAR